MKVPTDLEQLRARHGAGEVFDFVFFWGHRHPKGKPRGHSCLSQWYEAPFTLAGCRYLTAEHYMMAEKARLFGDEEALAKILAAPKPSAAKALGREVRGYANDVWLRHRFDIVVRGNLAKFGQNPALWEYLDSTEEKILVEASPVDLIWGIGWAENDPEAADPNLWKGLNLLGFALMAVRNGLKNSQPIG